MLFFIYFQILVSTQDIYIKFGKTYQVIQNNKVEEQFDLNILTKHSSCHPPKSFSITDSNSNYGKTNQTLIINTTLDVNYNVIVEQIEDNESIQTSTIPLTNNSILTNNSSVQYMLQQTCPAKEELTSQNYWTPITINVIFSNDTNQIAMPFVILFSCNKEYRALTFDWSLMILLIVTTTFVSILAKYTRILSFRWKRKNGEFQGFQVNLFIIYIYVSIYTIGMTIFMATNKFEEIKYILIIIAIILGSSGIFFITLELASLGKASNIIRRFQLIVATFVTLLISVPYSIYAPWYLSDILSLTFVYLLMKLFRFKNFKGASLFMIINIIMDITASLLVHYTRETSYNTLVLQYVNCPLEIQLPLIKLQFNKNCAWVSLFSSAIPGLFLSLAYRIDESKRTFTYGLCGVCSLIFGNMMWMLTTISIKHSIPQTIFIYPIMLMILSLNSIKRAEFRSFWFGNYLTDLQFYSQKVRGTSVTEQKQVDIQHFLSYDDETSYNQIKS